ncbi:M20 family metallopeptidase [bacterium]|nr:M20 family metallopeptidase [bacterium]
MSEVVSLLRDLVAIPSINPCGGPLDDTHGEARVVDFVAGWLAARQLDFELTEPLPGRPNLIARLAGRGGPSLVFEAHTDTVEVLNMQIEPFVPELRDGCVYGRGSCDCKSSLAAMLMALEQTARQGAPPGDVTLVAACDEEFRYRGVKHVVDSGFRADGGVVGEPTDLRVIIAHKGALRGQIITHGRAAHSSEPDKGESAIFHMARVLTALEQYGQELSRRPKHPLLQGPTVSVGLISGGNAPNIVPDRCEISLDRRVLPTEEAPGVEAELRAWLAEHAPVPWELQVTLADNGMDGAPDSAIARRAAAAVDAVLGRHEIAGVQYGTDASKLAKGGTPSVVIGPGNIAQAHTAVEWVEVGQVQTAVEVYRRLMCCPQ